MCALDVNLILEHFHVPIGQTLSMPLDDSSFGAPTSALDGFFIIWGHLQVSIWHTYMPLDEFIQWATPYDVPIGQTLSMP